MNDPTIYVDADACPVKEEVLKVAIRHDLKVVYVANAFMRLPDDPLVKRVVVSDGLDAADDYIADNTKPHDIVITNDIPLAGRCLNAGAIVLGATGKEFTDAGIGQALASRAISEHMREMGETTGGPKGFTAKDRSHFLQAMESACRRAKRGSGTQS